MISKGKLAVIGITLALVAGIVLYANRQTQSAARDWSASNLRKIGQACMLYAQAPGHGTFPDDPAKLFPDYTTEMSLFKNPRFPDEASGYIYVAGADMKDPAAVLVYENIPESAGAEGGQALTMTGAVESFSSTTRIDWKHFLQDLHARVQASGGKMRLVPIQIGS